MANPAARTHVSSMVMSWMFHEPVTSASTVLFLCSNNFGVSGT